MSNSKCDLTVGQLIKHLDHKITNKLNRNLTQYDLTGVQASVLIFLYFKKDKDIYQKDIEKHLKLTNPTVTGVVKRLEEKEMIKRFPSEKDGRYKCHVLTDKGHEVAKHAIDFWNNEVEKKLTEDFLPDERTLFITLLKRVIHNID